MDFREIFSLRNPGWATPASDLEDFTHPVEAMSFDYAL
jgi:hypothetical protein